MTFDASTLGEFKVVLLGSSMDAKDEDSTPGETIALVVVGVGLLPAFGALGGLLGLMRSRNNITMEAPIYAHCGTDTYTQQASCITGREQEEIRHNNRNSSLRVKKPKLQQKTNKKGIPPNYKRRR